MGIKGTFDSIDLDSKLFNTLIQKPPLWWEYIKANEKNDLHVDIRKDNYINVYYKGGSIAKIGFDKRSQCFKAVTHHKYLGQSIEGKKSYVLFDLNEFESNVEGLKTNVMAMYNRNKINTEKCIQADMILNNPSIIDSEFQYNGEDFKDLRIDLIELDNDFRINFIELKRIQDPRLVKRKNNPMRPEIISQMEKYNLFINKYSAQLIEYYTKLIKLKQQLGIMRISLPENSELKINLKPQLYIKDYETWNTRRCNRKKDIEALLSDNNIDYLFK